MVVMVMVELEVIGDDDELMMILVIMMTKTKK
jgi:hypothetical protein